MTSFKKSLDATIDALYKLNFWHGQLLNDGLEDKVDQLQNLLTAQLNDILSKHEH